MKIHNKLDKSFGPVGSWAGICLFIVGIVTIYTSLFGLVLIILGAFVGFSSTSAIIDFDLQKVKFSNDLFGIIKTGKWIPIEPSMKFGIKESSISWRAFSRGNRPIDIPDNDFRLILIDGDKQEIMQIKKTNSLASARLELEALCNVLNVSAIDQPD